MLWHKVYGLFSIYNECVLITMESISFLNYNALNWFPFDNVITFPGSNVDVFHFYCSLDSKSLDWYLEKDHAHILSRLSVH